MGKTLQPITGDGQLIGGKMFWHAASSFSISLHRPQTHTKVSQGGIYILI